MTRRLASCLLGLALVVATSQAETARTGVMVLSSPENPALPAVLAELDGLAALARADLRAPGELQRAAAELSSRGAAPRLMLPLSVATAGGLRELFADDRDWRVLPSLGDSPVLRQVVADRARALSLHPEAEALILLVPVEGGGAPPAGLKTALGRLGFASVGLQTWDVDAADPGPALVELAAQVDQAHAAGLRALLLPCVLDTRHGFLEALPSALSGRLYLHAGQGLAPHEAIATWALEQVLAGSRSPASPVDLAAAAADADVEPLDLPQTAFQESVVVQATRTQADAHDLPLAVSVVEGEQLDRQVSTGLGDLFRQLPGVSSDGSGPFLGRPVIRGESGNRVLVLVDGQRLNNAREAVSFGGVEPGLVGLDSIERVEVVRGPGSVIHGSDAVGGIVNIITDRSANPGVKVTLGTDLSSAHGGGSAHARVQGSAERFSADAGFSASDHDDYESAQGTVGNSATSDRNADGQFRFELPGGHELSLKVVDFEARDVGIPGAEGVFNASYPSTRRRSRTLGFELDPGDGALRSLSIVARAQAQDETFATLLDLDPVETGSGPFDPVILVDSVSERTSRIDTLGLDVDASWALGDQSPHLLTAGLDFTSDRVREDRSSTTISSVEFPQIPGTDPVVTTELDGDPTTPPGRYSTLGLFIQDEWEVSSKLRLLTALRHDWTRTDTNTLFRETGALPGDRLDDTGLGWSLGATWRVRPGYNLIGSVARYVRIPNLLERWFYGPGSQGGLTLPNPALRSETGHSFELGFKWDRPRFTGGVAVYQNEMTDRIGFQSIREPFPLGDTTIACEDPELSCSQLFNASEATLRGFELDGEYRWPARALTLAGSITVQDGEQVRDGREEPITSTSPLTGQLRLSWLPETRPYWVEGRVRHVASKSQSDLPSDSDTEPTDAFTTLSVRAGWNFRQGRRAGHSLSLGVENLTDEAYSEPLRGFLEPGRSVVLGYQVELRP
ncbi:MAG: TonB-dependent receptor [Acidobacteriota bacterium]